MTGTTTYLDSCVVIYLVEQHPSFAPRIGQAMSESDALYAISPLVRMECLIKPLRDKDADLSARYRQALSTFAQVPINDEDFELAAQLRADHGLKTPDALHLAIARRHRCTALWTNDDRFAKAAPGYTVDIRTL